MTSMRLRVRACAVALLVAAPLLASGCSAPDDRWSCVSEGEGFVKLYGYGVSTAPPAGTHRVGRAGDWTSDGCAGAGARSAPLSEAEQGWAVCMAAAGLGRFTAKGEPFHDIVRRFAVVTPEGLEQLQRDERTVATVDYECARDSGYIDLLQAVSLPSTNGEARRRPPQLG